MNDDRRQQASPWLRTVPSKDLALFAVVVMALVIGVRLLPSPERAVWPGAMAIIEEAGAIAAENITAGAADDLFVPLPSDRPVRAGRHTWVRLTVAAPWRSDDAPVLVVRNLGGRSAALALGGQRIGVAEPAGDWGAGAYRRLSAYFRLPPTVGPDTPLYLHITGAGRSALHLALESNADVEAARIAEARFLTAIISILLTMGTASAIAYIGTKERLFLLFAVFTVAQAGYVACSTGEAYTWPLFAGLRPFNYQAITLTVVVATIGVARFVEGVLLDAWPGRGVKRLIDAFVWLFVGLGVGGLAAAFVQPIQPVVSAIGNLAVLVWSVFFFAASLIAMRRGSRAAALIFFGWTPMWFCTVARAEQFLRGGYSPTLDILFPASIAIAALAMAWSIAEQWRRQRRAIDAAQQLVILGEVGRQITATLDLDAILESLYVEINRMLDATVLGIGLYDPEREEIDFMLAIERGQRYQPYVRRMDDKNQLAVWCVEHAKPILIGDYAVEYRQYLTHADELVAALVDGSLPQQPKSALYLPLMMEQRVIGVLSVQSFSAHAYAQRDLDLLQALASYTAVAIDNARTHSALEAAHRSLIAAQQQLVLQEKMASLGTLTAGVAHEINNPNNFVSGAVQNLEAEHANLHAFLRDLAGSEAPAEVLAEFAHRFDRLNEMTALARHGQQRIKAIVQDLRQFTRLDEAERKRVPIAEPIRTTVELVKSRFAHITFDVRLDANPTVECQPAKLGQLFMNLIDNACDAIGRCVDGRSGVVRISAYASKGGVAIEVSDNGCGMDDAVRSRAFEPFYTTKPVGSGAGLGLAIVFGIIKEHRGSIDVESVPGRGTRFNMQLPIQYIAH